MTLNRLLIHTCSLISPYGETTTKAGKKNIVLDVLIQIYEKRATEKNKRDPKFFFMSKFLHFEVEK